MPDPVTEPAGHHQQGGQPRPRNRSAPRTGPTAGADGRLCKPVAHRRQCNVDDPQIEIGDEDGGNHHDEHQSGGS